MQQLPLTTTISGWPRQPLACARPLGQHARSRLKRRRNHVAALPQALLVARSLIMTPTSPTQSEPLPRAKERAKERAKVKAKANGKVRTHPLMPLPLTPHELRVRVQIKGKVKAKPSNPQHFLPPSLSGRPFRVVRSARTPSQYTLWAVHLGPSGVPATHTLIPLPYIPPLRHSPGRPFRAVRSAIAVPHPNSPTPIPPLATLQAVHLGPSEVFAIVPLPAPLQHPLHLHSLEAVHLGPSRVTFICTVTTPHISPNHTTFHMSSLRAVHLGPSGVAIPVPLPLPFYPLSPPFPPLFHVVLGRPFRAVRGTINLILSLTLTPTLLNHAHGSSLHHIHHLSSL